MIIAAMIISAALLIAADKPLPGYLLAALALALVLM
jgi:hypothetical protein